jgi:hypothetical protein
MTVKLTSEAPAGVATVTHGLDALCGILTDYRNAIEGLKRSAVMGIENIVVFSAVFFGSLILKGAAILALAYIGARLAIRHERGLS